MKKSLFALAILVLSIVTLTACDKTKEENKNSNSNEVTSSATKFKEEYESLNGTEKNGKTIRSITIDEKNPFVYKEAEDIVTLMDNKESFVVYFGFSSCPWCRSVLPTLIKAAKDNGINTIYYVDVKDIRDVMEVDEDGKVITKTKGSDGYYKLLEKLDSVLTDYTLSKDDEKIETGSKRIYAPNVVVVKHGEAKKMTSGISEKQTDAYMELTDEILDDTYKQFDEVLKELDTGSCSLGNKC